jgi:outer membrane murein-binding lipoprotein Lpp
LRCLGSGRLSLLCSWAPSAPDRREGVPLAARTRTHVVSIGVALAALVLAGCANAAVLDRTATPQEALARAQGAADKVTEAESARLAMTQRTIFAGEDVAASTGNHGGRLPLRRPYGPGGPPIPEEHHKPWTKLELPKELAGGAGSGQASARCPMTALATRPRHCGT